MIDAFWAWIDKLRQKTGDSIIKAMTYTSGCRPYLKNYLKDGCCSLGNNLSENAIRPVVIGRKNWLFSESQDGADATVKYFSVIETAKANVIDVKVSYISFQKSPEHKDVRRRSREVNAIEQRNSRRM